MIIFDDKPKFLFIGVILFSIVFTSCKSDSSFLQYSQNNIDTHSAIIDSIKFECEGDLGEIVEIELEFFGWPCISPCPCPQWVPKELKDRILSNKDTIVPDDLAKELESEYSWIEPRDEKVISLSTLLANNKIDIDRLIFKFKGQYYEERQDSVVCSDTFNSKIFQYSEAELIIL